LIAQIFALTKQFYCCVYLLFSHLYDGASFKLHCRNGEKLKILKSAVTMLVTEETVLSDNNGKCTEK